LGDGWRRGGGGGAVGVGPVWSVKGEWVDPGRGGPGSEPVRPRSVG
jgi:hypothetical protein